MKKTWGRLCLLSLSHTSQRRRKKRKMVVEGMQFLGHDGDGGDGGGDGATHEIWRRIGRSVFPVWLLLLLLLQSH